MKRLAWAICLFGAAAAWGQSVSPEEAQSYVDSWLKNNPLALRYRQTQSIPLETGETEQLALGASLPPVFLVHLQPQGYVIVNSDRRLRPVVGFDFAGSPDLSNPPRNPFYQLLLAHGRQNAQTLAAGAPALSSWDLQPSVQIFSSSDTDVIGPLLATSWDQGDYYNEDCPPAAGAPDSFGGRAPTGCVATAFAQIMKYHEWPYHGAGSFTYTDAAGAITGPHTATFTHSYDWSLMQNEYYAFGREPDDAVQAVAGLMYDLGVAAQTNYEPTGSAAATTNLTSGMRQHFLYETPVVTETSNGVSFAGALLSDLAAHRPCVAGIPGHSFVVDGHMRQGADDFFHINYGWSGQNDGWFALADVQGQAVVEMATGITPLLVATPLGSVRTGQALELRWALPKTRTAEATQVDVLKRATISGTFTDHVEALNEFEVTSPDHYQDWTLAPGGDTGSCFYKPAGGYLNCLYHLTSTRVFRPHPNTSLTFQAKYSLYGDTLSVGVSTDNGDSFTPVWSITRQTQTTWTPLQVSLGAFAGQDILVRFQYTPGNPFYVGGGVWLDEIQMASTDWYDWSVLQQVHSLQAYRAVSTVVFQDGAEAFTAFKVTSTSHYQDWSLSPSGYRGNCFYKPTGGYSNVQYHVTSTTTFRPGPHTRLTFKTKYALASDSLLVRVSTNQGGSFSTIWTAAGTIRRNWTDVQVPLDAWAGQDLLIRFEYVPGSYYPNQGVYLDEIQLVDITGAEYLAYPVYHTTLTNPGPGTSTLAYQVWAGTQLQPRSESFTVDSVP